MDVFRGVLIRSSTVVREVWPAGLIYRFCIRLYLDIKNYPLRFFRRKGLPLFLFLRPLSLKRLLVSSSRAHTHLCKGLLSLASLESSRVVSAKVLHAGFPTGNYWYGTKRKQPGRPPRWVDNFLAEGPRKPQDKGQVDTPEVTSTTPDDSCVDAHGRRK